MNHTNEAAPSTAINIGDAPSDTRGKAPMAPPRAPFFALFRKTEGGWKRGVALFDFILRLCAFGATLVAAILMVTTEETLPFYTEHYQFHASYDDLPALVFFVIGNAIAAGYLLLSLPCSFIGIIWPHAVGRRLLLFIFDLVIMALTTAAAASATAIVDLAHTGNSKANWVAICLRFDGFCQKISGAVVTSFIGVLILILIIVISAIALRKH